MDFNGLREKISTKERATKRKHGIVVPENELKLVTYHTVDNYIKRHKLELGTKQGIQDSRIKSCMCPFMSYAWYLICYAMSSTLLVYLVVNGMRMRLLLFFIYLQKIERAILPFALFQKMSCSTLMGKLLFYDLLKKESANHQSQTNYHLPFRLCK